MTESPMAVTVCPSGRGRGAGVAEAGGDALGVEGVALGLGVAVAVGGLDGDGARGTRLTAVWATGTPCELDEVIVRDFPWAGWPPIW
jgi:hypothetical protein